MPAESSIDHWEMLRRGGQASTALEIPSIDTGIKTGSGSVRLALGNAGELVNEITGRQPAHRESEFEPERQAMQHHAERKADHRRRDRSTEDDDDGVLADEHLDIATKQHQCRDDNRAGDEAHARHDIHGRLQRVRNPPSS